MFVDGSYYKPTNIQEAAMGWSVVVVAQITLPTLMTYIADISAQPITQTDLDSFSALTPGNDIAEAAAVHNALLWPYTHASHSVPCHIHYDSKAAGCAAEGLYNASPNIAALTRASRGISHALEARGTYVTFTHEHSHMGHPPNDLADAPAKAAALLHYKADHPTIPPYQLYDITHTLADLLWLTDLPPDRKKANGLPPTEGNYIPCPSKSLLHASSSELSSSPPQTPPALLGPSQEGFLLLTAAH